MATWALLALVPVAAGAMLGFASYYGDHMVLQKEPAGAVVWGYGEPGASVTVALSKDGGLVVMKKTAPVKGPSGTWTTVLDPMDPGGPYALTAGQGSENVTLRDIYFGDVWLCSGQSNMAMTVLQIANASRELAAATRYPYIRVFAAAPTRSDVELEDLERIDLPWAIPTAARCFLNRKPGPREFHLLLGRLLAVGALPLRGSAVPPGAGGGGLGGHPHRGLVLPEGSAGVRAPAGRGECLPAPAALRSANALRALERHDPPAAQHDAAGHRLVPGRGQRLPAHGPVQLHLPRAHRRLAPGFPRRIGRADRAAPPLRLRAVVHLSPAEPGRQLRPSPLAPNSRSGARPQRQDARHLHGRGHGSVRRALSLRQHPPPGQAERGPPASPGRQGCGVRGERPGFPGAVPDPGRPGGEQGSAEPHLRPGARLPSQGDAGVRGSLLQPAARVAAGTGGGGGVPDGDAGPGRLRDAGAGLALRLGRVALRL